MAHAPNQNGSNAGDSAGTPSKVGESHRALPLTSSDMKPRLAMSALFQASRPKNPGKTYAAQNSNSAKRGKRRTADWATMAGVGWFTKEKVSGRKKGSTETGLPFLSVVQVTT